MKVGIELQIDVTKIDKARLFQGKKGNYLTLTTFVDLDEKDQYDNNGFITQKKNKDEQGQLPILGNTKVFWSDQQIDPSTVQQAPQQKQQFAPQPQQQQYAPQSSPMNQNPNQSAIDPNEDIPFMRIMDTLTF